MAIPTQSPDSPSDPSAQAIAVRLESVEKRYGDVVAVDGVDLDVRDGEFFSMLGPSGSGKTTVLRMIAGFELPTAGRVLLHGADVTEVPPCDRDVNTVFQDYALFPHMSVGDNVGYGLVVRKVVRHVDDLVQGGPPELHAQVDGLHHLAQGERRCDRLLR